MQLLKISKGIEWNNSFSTQYIVERGHILNFAAGIYYIDFNGLYTLRDDSEDDGLFETLNVPSLLGISYDNIQLAEKTSLSSLYDEPSYFYDTGNRLAYFTLPDFDIPELYDIRIGIGVYTCKDVETYIDDEGNTYDPTLKDVTPIKYSIPDEFKDVIPTPSVTFTIDNHDGAYDDFFDEFLYKQKAEMLLSYNDSTPEVRYTGFIETFSISDTEFKVTCRGNEKLLEVPIIQNYFTAEDYPNIYENDLGNPIPVRYGYCRRVRPTAINFSNGGVYNESLSQTVTFKVADTSIHPISVLTTTNSFQKGNSYKTISNVDLANGTFDYSKAANEEIDFDNVWITFTGYENDSGQVIQREDKIIIDLIENYANIPYSDSSFYTTIWGIEGNKYQNAYMNIEDDKITVKDMISLAMQSTRAIFYTNFDGKYETKKVDFTNPSVKSISKEEILSYGNITENYNPDDIVATVSIDYANGQRVIDKTNEDLAFKKYNSKRKYSFESNLKDTNGAIAIAAEYADQNSGFRPLRTFTLGQAGPNGIDPSDYFLGDILNVEFNRPVDTFRGYKRGVIYSISIDPNTGNYTFTIKEALAENETNSSALGTLYGQAIYGLDIYGG